MPFRLSALVCAALMASCATSAPVEDVLQEISALDYRMGPSEELDAYYSRMRALVRPRVSGLKRVEELEALLIACRLFRTPELPQERLQDAHPTYFAWSLVLSELETRRCDASARALVDLAADPRLGWDASSALEMGEAVVKRGRDCLPYLRSLDPSYRPSFIRPMITKIERGSTSYLFD